MAESGLDTATSTVPHDRLCFRHGVLQKKARSTESQTSADSAEVLGRLKLGCSGFAGVG